MALKNRCQACDFVIEASDAMRGQEVVCPQCKATNVLRSTQDAELAVAEQALARARERQRFLDGLGRAPATPARGTPASGVTPRLWSHGLEPVSFATLAGQRLKDVSTWLVGLSFIVLALSILLVAAIALGTGIDVTWKIVAAVGGLTVGVVLFVFLKFMSDAMLALADLSDLARSLDARVAALAETKDRPAPAPEPEPMPQAARPAPAAPVGR